MTLAGDDFIHMLQGSLNPTTAFMSGKLKIKGNLGMATKLEKIMKQTRSKMWSAWSDIIKELHV